MNNLIRANKKVLFVLVSVLVSGLTYGQPQNGDHQGPPPIPSDEQIEKIVEDLAKTLSLSDEQEIAVSEKYFVHFAAVEKKMKTGRPSHETMHTMKIDFEKQVKMLLTKGQQDLFTNYLKEQQQKRPPRQKR